MNPAILSVFISSCSLGLIDERETLQQTLRALRESGFLGKEIFGGRETPGRRISLGEIEKSQIYILILGGHYGAGIIEDEYRRALDRNLTSFFYCKEEEIQEEDPDRIARFAAFKKEIAGRHTVVAFSTPEELASRILKDMLRWHFDRELTFSCANQALGNLHIKTGRFLPLRFEIGSEFGGVIYPTPHPTSPSRAVASSSDLPRPVELIGRDDEFRLAKFFVEHQAPVLFYGASGMGKSSMLYNLGRAFNEGQFPHGVVYLAKVGRKAAVDLLQILFHTLFEHENPQKYIPAEAKELLGEARALILLDDLEMEDADIERVMSSLPNCVFAFGSDKQRLTGLARQVELEGLPVEEAVELLSNETGRSFEGPEFEIAASLCEKMGGNPNLILAMAGLIPDEGRSLAGVVQTPNLLETVLGVSDQALRGLSEPEIRMMLALAAANGAPLSPQTISSLTGIPSVVPILESLCLRRLMKDYGNRLRLSDALTKHFSQTMDLTGIYRQLLDFFVAWVERHRDNPARVQREWDAIFATPELSRMGGSPSTIVRLGKALDHSLALSGQWTLWEETLQKVLVAAQIEEDRYNEAWALHQMGARAMCLGEEESAEYFLNRAFEIRSAIGDPFGAAVTQHNLELLLQQQEAAKGSMALVRIGNTALTFSNNDDEEPEEDSALMIHPIALEHRPRSLVRSAGASFIRLAVLLALMIGSHSSLEVASKQETIAAFAPSEISITGQPINSVSLPYMAFFINQQQTPLSIGEIVIDGDSLNEFVITENNCTDISLIPNGNCKISVAYSPSTGGRHTASLVVKTKDGLKAAELTLTGVVAGREGVASATAANEDEELLASMTPMATSTSSGDQPLSVNTTVIAFEHLGDGKKSIAQVSLQNETDRSVPVSELKLIGAGAPDFRVKNNCQPQLTAKRKCRIDFEYKPQLSGERMAALKISSSPDSLPLYVLLKGVSLAEATNVEVASAKVGPGSALPIEARPSRVDFGLAVSRTAASQEILTFKNLSASPLTISSISLKDGAGFLLNDVNCRGRSINPQDSCSLSLGFKPPGDGEYKATLIIQTASGISPLTIPIEGRAQLIGAQAPNLAIFPNPLKLNFTGRPASDSKLTRGIVRLSNQGENTLTVNEVDVDGPDADVFNLAHQCKGAQLAPDGHCDIEVVFKPPQASSPAERRARLIVKFNGGAASQSIVLNGSIGGQR